MNNKFTTFILMLILIVLVVGSAVVGIAIYSDITGGEDIGEVYTVENIATEEPTKKQNKNLEIVGRNISESINGISDENLQATQGNSQINTDTSINKYFYQQITGNAKIIYDKLLENKDKLRQGNYVIEFKDTFSKSLANDENGEQLGRDYQTAIEAFMHDNPELFYIDVNKMYLNIRTTTKLLKTSYNVYISPASDSTYFLSEFSDVNQIENAINKIELIKNNIVSNLSGSEHDKVTKIHNYLVDNIEYDSTYQEVGIYGVYGALIGKKSVCEGYAKAFKYLANSAGIECEIMQGTATNSTGKTESHAWNCVKVDGTWYEVDATWDDPIMVGNGFRTDAYKYKYFLKGSKTFEKDHTLSYQFSENGKVFEYPSISIRDY